MPPKQPTRLRAAPSLRPALTQLLQPFPLLLSPLADALRFLSQSVSLGNCRVAICWTVGLLGHKHTAVCTACAPALSRLLPEHQDIPHVWLPQLPPRASHLLPPVTVPCLYTCCALCQRRSPTGGPGRVMWAPCASPSWSRSRLSKSSHPFTLTGGGNEFKYVKNLVHFLAHSECLVLLLLKSLLR